MDGIFISYRRDDSAGYAGRLYDRLAGHFGPERVFMDVEGIEPGVDFVTAIEEAVSSCRVLIVIIGDEWTQARDAAGRRRLDDPNDFIRLETGTALQRGIRVVPVLVEGAGMPHIDDLPDDLKLLTRRQAIEISHKQWESSTGELIRTLESLLAAAPVVLPRDAPLPESLVSTVAAPTLTAQRQWVWLGAAALLITLASAWWFSRGQGGGVLEAPMAPDVSSAAVIKPEISDEPARTLPATPVPTTVLVPPPPAPAEPAEVAPETAPVVAREDPVTPLLPEPVSTKKAEPEQPVAAAAAVVKPSAEPVRPVAPTPVPPPVVASPVIRSFRAEIGPGRARLCYRVSNADQLTLSPRPGTLDEVTQDCVEVELEQKTLFTLAARNAKQTVRKNLLVVPEVRAVAAIEPLTSKAKPPVAEVPEAGAAHLPLKGESWTYRSSGKWPTSPKRVFEVTVQSASGSVIKDALRVIEPDSAFAGQQRQSNGKQPDFVSWSGIGIEFSPYLGTMTDLARQESMSNVPTPDLDRLWGQWFSSVKVLGKESVSVPAGSFDAYKVEVWSNRHTTGSQIEAGVEPVSIRYLIWYAAQAKRYVKMQRQLKSASGVELEHEVFELVSHKSP